MAINVSISAGKASGVNKAGKGITSSIKVAKLLKKMRSHNSIAKMANDGIYQYPVLMSTSFNTDDAITIARAHEKQCAAFVVIAYALYGTMDNKKYQDIGDFVKKFHNNKNIPTNFIAAKSVIDRATESTQDAQEQTENITVESFTYSTVSDPFFKDVAKQCWGFSRDQVDMESLNDIYKPYTRTARIIEEKIHTMKTANESAVDLATSIADAVDNINITERSGGIYEAGPKNRRIVQKTGANAKNEVVKNDKLSALEPTMVNVTITRHGLVSGQSGPTSYLQTLTLGVKAMVRLVRSDLMVANMVEACKDANAIFKFIKWTKGEINLVDKILGISEAKAAALANSSVEQRILKAAKKRKKINNVSKFLNNEVFPTLAIFLTTTEVLQIKSICGVDLSQLYNALKLMNKYYLLAFGIYNPETQVLQVIYDGDDDFAYTTIGNLRSQENKDINVASAKDVFKLMGRFQ